MPLSGWIVVVRPSVRPSTADNFRTDFYVISTCLNDSSAPCHHRHESGNAGSIAPHLRWVWSCQFKGHHRHRSPPLPLLQSHHLDHHRRRRRHCRPPPSLCTPIDNDSNQNASSLAIGTCCLSRPPSLPPTLHLLLSHLPSFNAHNADSLSRPSNSSSFALTFDLNRRQTTTMTTLPP